MLRPLIGCAAAALIVSPLAAHAATDWAKAEANAALLRCCRP